MSQGLAHGSGFGGGGRVDPALHVTKSVRSYAALKPAPPKGRSLAFDPYFTGQRIRPSGKSPPFLRIFGTIVRPPPPPPHTDCCFDGVDW